MLTGATRAQRRVADRYHRVRANPTDPLAFGVIGERPDGLSIVRRLVWFYLALSVGLGPTTYGLTDRRYQPAELRKHIRLFIALHLPQLLIPQGVILDYLNSCNSPSWLRGTDV